MKRLGLVLTKMALPPLGTQMRKMKAPKRRAAEAQELRSAKYRLRTKAVLRLRKTEDKTMYRIYCGSRSYGRLEFGIDFPTLDAARECKARYAQYFPYLHYYIRKVTARRHRDKLHKTP
jgi:hypothetical protein